MGRKEANQTNKQTNKTIELKFQMKTPYDKLAQKFLQIVLGT